MDYFKILDSINEIIYVSDMNSYEMIYANEKFRKAIGKNLDEIKGQKCYECLLNETKPCSLCYNIELKDEKNYTWFEKENESSHYKGEYYLRNESFVNIDGRDCRVSMAVDVSKIGQDLSKLQESLALEKRLESCIRNLVSVGSFEDAVNSVLKKTLDYFQGDRAFIFDLDWEKNLCSNTFEQCIPGMKKEIHHLHRLSIDRIDSWLKLLEEKTIVSVEDMNIFKDDETKQIEYKIFKKYKVSSLIMVSIVYNDKIQGILGISNPKANLKDNTFLKDLTFFMGNEMQKNNLNNALHKLSYHDILTGLNNRNAYNLTLNKIQNYKTKGVVFVDMNGLKYLNDNFGHLYGDNKLCQLANILKEEFGEDNTFRISGDEFAVLEANIEEGEFINKCKHLEKRLKVDEEGLGAIGYIWDNKNRKIKDLIQQAEELMYIDKQNYYMENDIFFRNTPPKYLKKALDEIKKREFLVYLQPKYSFDTGQIYGAEALVRMKSPDGKILCPNKFIHILEKENLISYVDFFVFEEICKLLVLWQKKGYENLAISSNFSRVTIADNNFVNRIKEICQRTGVNCSKVILEITESSNIVSMEKLEGIMCELKKLGLRFALDDMGTEYSSLEMLEIEELDMAKIDRQMIIKISSGNRVESIIGQIIDLCHNFGMECVAEGVETEEQFNVLKNIGCDKIQGYLIGKPMTIDEFEEKYI